LFGSFQQVSTAGGSLLGSAVAAIMTSSLSQATMLDWGWRVPFLLGVLLLFVGAYLRRNVDETPTYEASRQAAVDQPVVAGLPLGALAFGFTIFWTIAYYTLLAWMPSFTQRFAGLTPSQALWSNTIGLLVLVVAIPLMGKLSDRIGRKPVLLACCAAFIILPYPIFSFLVSGASYGALIAVQILFAVLISMFSGPGPAAISEIFPTRTRSTWMTSGYALAVSIFGGFAPYIAVRLIEEFDSPLAHTFYLIAAAVDQLEIAVKQVKGSDFYELSSAESRLRELRVLLENERAAEKALKIT